MDVGSRQIFRNRIVIKKPSEKAALVLQKIIVNLAGSLERAEI